MLPKPLTIPLLILAVLVFSGCNKRSNNDAITTPKQPVDTPGKQSYTAKMGGMRNWHGWHSYHASGMHFPVPIDEENALPDTSFALTIVDDSTVQFGNTTYGYERTDTAWQVYYFGDAYYYKSYGMGKGIMYFYAKDSILHCNGDKHGTVDSWTLSNTYFTY